MTVRRLRVASLPADGGSVSLIEASARHARVLRLRAGDEVVLFDGQGGESRAKIVSVEDAEFICEAEPPRHTHSAVIPVVLMLAIPKGSTVDACVRMATELGVGEVALFYSERTVPWWDRERAASRLERLTRIASEASAQCERSDLPLVHAPESLETCLGRVPSRATGLVFGARAAAPMSALPLTTEQVWCAIGPEGGFADSELEVFRAAGFAVVSLGELVLRVETAVPAALAVVLDRLGDLRQPR